MFNKLCIFFAVLAFSIAAPAPEAKAKADPTFVTAAYSAPIVPAPIAYSAPLAYSAGYVAPAIYNAGYTAGYTAYSPYTGSLVVV